MSTSMTVRTFSRSLANRAFSSKATKRVVVVGGNGYVGSHVCQAAVARGLEVLSINRSGRPTAAGFEGQEWLDKVEWVQGSALEPEAWKQILSSDAAVVSTVGAFGSYAFMQKMCGDTNISAAEAAAEAGVQHFVFVSAHNYNLIEGLPPISGYFGGKRRAEKRIRELFGDNGTILRPGFIYGTRHVGGMSIPLRLVGRPLEMVCALSPVKAIAKLPLLDLPLTQPVAVESVGKAAVAAALGESEGDLDVDGISKFN